MYCIAMYSLGRNWENLYNGLNFEKGKLSKSLSTHTNEK